MSQMRPPYLPIVHGAEAMTAKSNATVTDTQILNWLIFYAGRIVVCDSAETVYVEWYSDGDEKKTPLLTCNPREAVIEAMELERL